MRRLVAVLIVAALAVSLAGCGGGGEATTTPPAGGTAAPAAAPPPATPPTIPDRSANETITFVPFPLSSTVPTAVRDAVTAKQPTLIFFYDSADNVSKETQDIIEAVRDDNRGLVDLITYDIGKWVTASESGTLTVDPAFANDREARQSVQLARNLGASAIPFVVLTDSQGYIIWKFRGLVDQAFLEREVLRAAK